MNIGAQLYTQLDTEADIENADSHRLIQLLMGGILERLGKAKVQITAKNYAKKGELLSNCCEILATLIHSLDHEQGGEIALNLERLYVYMIERLTLANAENSIEPVDEVIKLMTEIKLGWDGIRQQLKLDKS